MKRFFVLFFVILIALATIAFFTGRGDFFARILRDGGYILNFINKENSVLEYAPPDLIELSQLGARGEYVREIAYDALKNLMEDASAAGAPLKIVSAYRSYERQEQVFGYWSKRDPNANRYSAEAGHSEHQLGTTIDFGMGNGRVDLRWEFGEATQGKWLEENAWIYGFAMSYPKNKEDVTGYVYEPWHFRYIGKEAAREWRESGLTLSEYLLTRPQYYRLIRRFDDYKIYSVDPDGTRHWITTAEKFLEMGYGWKDVVVVDRSEFNSYTEGSKM